MRIVHTAFVILPAVCVVSSVGFAQVLVPFPTPTNYDSGLDHSLPVATFSRVGDIVALDKGRVVQDPSGVPFVLGAATLDLRDAAHAKVVFNIANTTATPIALNDVSIAINTMFAILPDGTVHAGHNSYSGRASRDREQYLQPGASVSVQIPVSDPRCAVYNGECETRGFLVFVGRAAPLPNPDTTGPAVAARRGSSTDVPMRTKVFEALITAARH